MKGLIKLLCGSGLCLLFGCMQQDQQLEANKKLVKDAWDAFNQHDAAKATSYYAENAVFIDYGSPKPDTGTAQIQRINQMYITAFPDVHVSFEGEVAHGDIVVTQWHAVGTNAGPFMEMPATNKRVDLHGCAVFHVVNGKIVHQWQYWDHASLMQQLGMMPPGAVAEKKEMKKK